MGNAPDGSHDGFVQTVKFRIKHVELSEYVSLHSGVRVFFMNFESPLVNTYIVVPTREETDEGLPHTLEHLIFIGSKNYPFRGILDLISCKSLASGTNAWTSIDHTGYTLSTAGLEGTLQMLPIFLDHILRPTLTDIAFMTDVHYVGADGASSGVVYCEMKARENNSDELMTFEALDHLYPGDSGYKRNTGGKLSALRETNVHRVREFHKRFYKWENTSIVLCGNIPDVKAVLALVREQELAIQSAPKGAHENPSPKKQRTQTDPAKLVAQRFTVWDDEKHVAKLERSTVSTVEFPSEEESCGTFCVSWRGPAWDDIETIRAISLMGSYLVDSTASPLEKALVHTADPCGSCVDFSIELLKEVFFQLIIKDVPVDGEANKMEAVGKRLREALTQVLENTLDMDRMKMLIMRCHHNYLRQIETCPHETLIDSVVGYAIYGNDPEQLKKLVLDAEMVETLLGKDEAYWKNVLRTFFLDAHSVTVKCTPSVRRAKEIEEEERELREAQLKKYGAEQLSRNKQMVDEEVARNRDGPPKEILDQFKQCDTKLIKLPAYPLYRNFRHRATPGGAGTGQARDTADADKRRRWEQLDAVRPQLDRIGYPVQVNNIPTDFVRVDLVFSTCKLGLSAREKKLLMLLCVLVFESNVRAGGRLVSADEFIKMLMENTTSYGANLGLTSTSVLPDSYADLVTVYLTCPADRYTKVLELVELLMHHVEYEEEILGKHVKSLLKAFAKKKRSARTLMKQLSNHMSAAEGSVRHLCSLGQQDAFLRELEGGLATEVVAELKKLHARVFRPENMALHVTADLSKLGDDWLDFWVGLASRPAGPAGPAGPGVLNEYLGFEYGRDKNVRAETGLVASLASTDVAYALLTAPAPYGYNNADYFKILTLCEYLNMTEGRREQAAGPLYRAIRGNGYAYHHSVAYRPAQGEVQLAITEATDLPQVGRAHAQAFKVTAEVIAKSTEPDADVEHEVLAAKSSLIYRILSNEESLADYSQETFTSALRQTDVDFNKHAVVRELELGALREAFAKYFGRLPEFEGPPKTLACIASTTQVGKHTAKQAKNMARALDAVNLRNVRKLDSKALMALLASGGGPLGGR